MRPRETINEQTGINFDSKHGKFLKEILAFYVPLLLKLPQLRTDKEFMEATIKAVGNNGIDDVATKADKWMQGEIKMQSKNYILIGSFGAKKARMQI